MIPWLRLYICNKKVEKFVCLGLISATEISWYVCAKETKLRQDSKGTRSSFKFISQQCFHCFFMLASLIVHSVVFLPMTIELSTISYKNNNKHYHITHNDRTFLN